MESYLTSYDIWVPGVTNGLFLIDNSGSGKSTTLCKLYDNLIKKADLKTIILCYNKGIAKDIHTKGFWTEIIARRCDLDKSSHISTLFTQTTLLGYKFVILIDPLDSIDEKMREIRSCRSILIFH